MNDFEKYVWFYYNKGFSIIPTKARSKKPNIESWESYQEKRASKKQIQEWLDQGKFEGIGIILGDVSGGLEVIDIDDATLLEELGLRNSEKLTKTWLVITGKGGHWYMKHSGKCGSIEKPVGYNIERRTNGGYVVAPPSVHETGKQYTFYGVKDMEELPELIPQNVDEIWKDLKQKVEEIKDIKTKEKIRDAQDKRNKNVPPCINFALKGVKEGHRDDTGYGIASYYKQKGVPFEATLNTLKQWNRKNKPPLPSRDLEVKIISAYKDEKEIGCNWWQNRGMCPIKPEKCSYHQKEIPLKLENILALPDWEINGTIHNLIELRKNVDGGKKDFLLKVSLNDNEIKAEEIQEYRYLPETQPSQAFITMSEPKLDEIHEELRIEQSKHVYFRDEIDYDILSLMAESTYFREIFNTYPYADFYAIENACGKTTAMLTLIWSCYYGFPMIIPTPAILFRTVEDNHGAIGIDEIDELFKNPKQNRDILTLIDCGHTKGVKAYRMEMDSKPPKIVGYDPFGFKSFTRTSDVPRQVISRSITFRMVKNKGFKKLKKKPAITNFTIFRDQLYRFRLKYYEDVKGVYEELLSENILEARQGDMFIPLLTMAKLNSEELYKKTLEYAKKDEERRDTGKTDDRIINLLEVIVENNFIGTIPVKKVRDELNDRLMEIGELSHDHSYSSQTVIGWLEGLGFEKSAKRAQNLTHFNIAEDRLLLQACIYLFPSVPSEMPKSLDELKDLLDIEKKGGKEKLDNFGELI